MAPVISPEGSMTSDAISVERASPVSSRSSVNFAGSSPAPKTRGDDPQPSLGSIRAAALYRPTSVQPFRRRPADGVQLGIAMALLAACVATVHRSSSLEHWFFRTAESLPASLRRALEILNQGSAVWIVVVTVVLALVARRGRLARDLMIAGTSAWAIARILAACVDVDSFPSVRLAIVTTLMTSAAPYLVRPLRRLGQAGVVLLVVAGLYLGSGRPIDLAAGVLLGVVVAAGVHLAFGAPAGRPTPGRVEAALRRLGINVVGLAVGPEEGGVTTMTGSDCAGGAVHVRVLGRDELHAGLLSRTRRWLIYKDANPRFFVTRAQQMEHEAYVMLLAQRTGAPVAELLTAGSASDAAVLAERRPAARRLYDLDATDVSDEVLDNLWEAVGRLQADRIAHGALNGENLRVGSDRKVVIVNFGASLAQAPDDRLARDAAEALTATAIVVGVDRSVAAAARCVGAGALVPALRFLQEPALSRATNRALRGRRKLLGALRETGAEAAGVEAPKLEQLQRIRGRSLVMAVLMMFAVSSLLGAIGDPVDVYHQIKEASWGWVLLAAMFSAATNVTDAVAALGAIRQRVLLGPAVQLQVAGYFTGVAAPSSLGTFAMTTRFFQKRGVPTSSAVSSGALVSVTGTVVQLVLLAVCGAVSRSAFDLGESGSGGGGGGGSGGWLLATVVVVGVAIGVAMRVPSVRQRILRPVREAVGNVRQVLRAPRKVVQLVLGNVGSQVLYALCLGACLHAFGGSLPLAALILVNSGASMLMGISPVPGGLGVVEAALVAGLTAAGIPTAIAVPAALTHRLVTAWITPVFGWFAFRSLERRGEI